MARSRLDSTALNAAPPLARVKAVRLTAAQMYSRVLASDAAYNGRFFTGVLSTGIYCLPSCHARKPKPENVRFFASCEEARAAGLRPCLKCHPDDFARGADPVLESVESLVAEIRENPAAFANARAIVKRSGFGATRLFELFRLHYHTTPADLLLRARLAAARQRLLDSDDGLAAIAYEVGFDSLSSFHENFRRLSGLTPGAYRELRSTHDFRLELPRGYPLNYLRRALSRDIHSVNERLDGNRYRAAVRINGAPALLTLSLSPARVEVSLEYAGKADTGTAEPIRPGVAAHTIAAGLLGLGGEAAAFARLATRLGLERLVAGRRELRISQTPSIFDGLLWAIIGQQINFPFASLLKRRLFELAGTPVTDGLIAEPTPAAVAALTPADLLPLQFSRQKAEYLIGTAARVADGRLDLQALRSMSATRAERVLLAVRGLGPWSVNYIMMRSLGLPDCLPIGDTGVTSGLRSLLQLEERPDADATRRLMAVFSPYRSLATAHLWQFDQPLPA